MTETITDFLLARIEEDESSAEWVAASFPDGEVVPLFRRVLAECAAKRVTVEELRGAYGNPWEYGVASEIAAMVLGSLASVYSNHPDYRQDWAA